MNILLVQPPLTKDELYKRGSKATASIIPPLGLAYIAAVLENDGHKVEIIDGIVSDLSVEEIAQKAGSFDMVGLTVLSAFFKRCAELIRAIKGRSGVPLVAGGAHATAMPMSLLECGADYVVMGEGEETVRELVCVFQKGPAALRNVKGLAFLESGKLVMTQRRPLIDNLDSLPMPARHLLSMDKYKTSEARSRRNPSHSMVVSRGCPGTCTFCCKLIFGTNFRCRSPEKIVEEMFVLRDRYNAKEVAFLDDSFTTSRETVMSVCGLLVERKFDLPWSCEARIDSVDEEMLKTMKRSGCEFVAYGIESGSDRVLKSINKKIDTAGIERAVRMTHDSGILIRGYFMLGFIGETEEEMLQTIKFAIALDLDVASFSLLVPFPGTVDYVRAQREGGYFDPNFYRDMIVPEFNFPERPVYSPKGVTPEKMLEIHKLAYRKFYYRLPFVFKELSRIKTVDDVMRLAKGVVTLIKS